MTAEELFEKHWKLKTDSPIDDVIKLNMQYCVKAMQEYAEMKCKELLEIVVEKAKTKKEYLKNSSLKSNYGDPDIERFIVDKKSILNCIDLENFCK